MSDENRALILFQFWAILTAVAASWHVRAGIAFAGLQAIYWGMTAVKRETR